MDENHHLRRVVVFGGTGRTGRLVVRAAAEAGYTVTVAARRPDAVTRALPPGVSVVRADVHDGHSVAAALQDQDATVLCVSTSARKPGNLYSDAAAAIVTAAQAHPARLRVVAVSSGGVFRDDLALPFWYRRILIPFVMNDLYDDMSQMEQIITRSDLDWTIVRASYLRDGAAKGHFRVVDGSTPPRGWKLSRGDLAAFTVSQLGDDTWSRRFPTLAE